MRNNKATENKIKVLCQGIQILSAKTILLEKKRQKTGMTHVRI